MIPHSRKSPQEIFALYYQETRAHLLEAASALDRFERYDPAHSLPSSDPRYLKLVAAIAILHDGEPNRAERMQLALSDLS